MRSKKYLPFIVLVGIVVLSALRPATAEAQFRRGPFVTFRTGFGYDPFFYDPWFGYGYQYGYPPYPYPPYGYGRFDNTASVRLMVKPKQAEVFVDNYYAGVVNDFDGVFQRLHVPPGDHEITFYREGYHTAHQKLYLSARSDQKLQYTMTPLAAGEANEPRPVAPAPPPSAEGTRPGMYPPAPPYQPRRVPPPVRIEPEPPSSQPPQADNARYGTLSIRVQPSGAEVFIDGERWRGPENAERLVVQVPDGTHRIEVQKDGYQKYTAEVQVRRGETTPVNVSLSGRN